MNELFNVFKKLNIKSAMDGANKTLKTIKKAIPVYKEVRPFLNKEKSLFKKEEPKINNETKKEELPNDNLTFFN